MVFVHVCTVRSYYEAEKNKALKSGKWPRPRDVKKCLGDYLGGIVVGMFPEVDVARRLQLESIGGMVTAEHELCEDIQPTMQATDDETAAWTIDAIMRTANSHRQLLKAERLVVVAISGVVGGGGVFFVFYT